jgi:hypothetical protein
MPALRSNRADMSSAVFLGLAAIWSGMRREPRSRVQLIGTTIKDIGESSQFVTLEAAI